MRASLPRDRRLSRQPERPAIVHRRRLLLSSIRPSLVCMSPLSCCVPYTCLHIKYMSTITCSFRSTVISLTFTPPPPPLPLSFVLYSTPPLKVLKFWMAGVRSHFSFTSFILREQPNTKEDSTLAALLFSEDFCGKWDYYHPSQPVTPAYTTEVTSSASSAASSSSCNNSTTTSTANINTCPLQAHLQPCSGACLPSIAILIYGCQQTQWTIVPRPFTDIAHSLLRARVLLGVRPRN